MYAVSMKLWVDDERPAPDESWTVSKTGGNAAIMLTMYRDDLEEVSLDHDLGEGATGYNVLAYMISEKIWPKVLTIHTSNPPARKRMLAAANAEAPAEVEIFVITDHLTK